MTHSLIKSMYNLFGVDENTVQIISNYAFINDIL